MRLPDQVLLDVWGVLHDGRTPYEDAQPFLDRMRRSGVPVSLVSNASWTGRALAEHLRSLGFDLRGVHEAITAGDVARGLVRSLQPSAVFYEGLDEPVPGFPPSALARCDLIVLANATAHTDVVLDHALRHGVPVICANPDLAIWDRDGVATPKAGAHAQALAARGAKVLYAGKPEPGIFHRARKTARAVMIGDSPETDLAGAAAARLPAIWLRRRINGAEKLILERWRPLHAVRSLNALWPDAGSA